MFRSAALASQLQQWTPAWALRSLPAVVARVGEPHGTTLRLRGPSDARTAALLAEHARLHAGWQAAWEARDGQRAPPHSHHGTNTVLPGGGFHELHRAGVVLVRSQARRVE